ncbi:hypothetical protein E8E12_001349 [Didymella heteroderae]|uniref:Uncharacterized protein n=1 Tax=Didymella heteroderae TaxID=1769908 RepID=A0A9P4WWK9_9PLEO|nr:hypothetical protein E8E12_001349 [Didymella heteroderae]
MKVVHYKWGRWEEAMGLQKQLTIYLVARRITGAKAILDDNPGDKQNSPLAFDILTGTRKKLAGNEKDKIIALYGLFTEMEIAMPKPDYSLSVEDIYRKATVAAMNYDRTLWILYHAPSDKRRMTLASWVPDWAERGFEPSNGRYGVLRDRFAASGASQPTFRFSSDEKALIIRGKIIDTIIYKAEPLPDMVPVALRIRAGDRSEDLQHTYMQTNHHTIKILQSWISVSTWSDYPTGEDSKDALQRTLVQDLPEENGKYTADGSFAAWYHNMGLNDVEVTAGDFDQLSLDSQAVGNRSDSNLTMSFKMFGKNPFHSFVTVSNSLKCFFYTANNYFGTAPDPLPESMHAGDIIALVSGLEMPLVLRPVGIGYRLITHIYIHGVMYGELWPEADGVLEDITLI